MSSRLGSFVLGVDVLSGSQGFLADLITNVGSNPTWLRDDPTGFPRALAVEVALPSNGDSLLGEFVLGVSVLSGLDWYPVTDRWQGSDVSRGSSDDSSEVGTATLVLDNDDDSLSPWSTSFPHNAAAYAGPGTLVRLSTYNGAEGWNVQFAGVVEAWKVVPEALGRLRSVVITAAETITELAQVNDIALSSVVGFGELTRERVARLLNAAGWQYGLRVLSSSESNHQATDMAQNRLTELYLTADSSYDNGTASRLRFRADRTGAALLGLRGKGVDSNGIIRTWFVDEATEIDSDTLDIANDGDQIVNVVSLAVVGGTAQTFENSPSIGRHRRRSTQRLDLNAIDPSFLWNTGLFDSLAASILGEGAFTLRPASFDVSETTDPHAVHWVDVDTPLEIETVDGVTFYGCRVAGLHHVMRPCGDDGIEWTMTVLVRAGSHTLSTPV